MAVELKPHQEKAVKEMHNGCILYGGTGVGKTITSLAYFFTEVCGGELGEWGFVQGARDLYVITTAKKRDTLDWQNDALKFGITAHDDDNVNGINLVVDSWNNIDKYKDVKDAFFIFDEQRLVGSGAWSKAFIKIAKSNEWVLLTATPGDTWLDYITVFVANGFYKNRTEFKLRHVVYNTHSKHPKVDRYLEPGHLLKLRNQILVHMPYERHTIRHEQIVHVDHDKDLMKQVEEKRWHVYEKRPLRDAAEQLAVMRRVVNSDTSRLEALRELVHSHPKVIVFYNFDYELEMLRTLGQSHSPLPGEQETISEESASPSGESSTSETPSKESKSTSTGTRTGVSQETLMTLLSEYESSLPRLRSQDLITTTTPTKHSRSICSDITESIQNSGMEHGLLQNVQKTSVQTQTPAGTSFSSQPGLRLNETPSSSASAAAQPSTEHSSSALEDTTSGTLSTTAGSGFQIAEWNGHKHEPIPTTDSWVYLVQYMAGSESWNCVETDTVVFWSQTYSYKHHQQARGRIDRMNTPFRDLWYVTFMSDSRIDQAVAKALKQKKNFNEASIAPKW